VAGDPDSNLASLITRGHIDLDFVYFISSRDPEFLGAGGPGHDLASPASGITDDFLDGWDAAHFIVAWLDEDALPAPLVVPGLGKHLLGAGLVLSGDPAPGRGVLKKKPSQVDAQGQAVTRISGTVSASSLSRCRPSLRSSRSGIRGRRKQQGKREEKRSKDGTGFS